MATITVRNIEPKLFEKIKMLAKRDGVSVPEFVRRLLRREFGSFGTKNETPIDSSMRKTIVISVVSPSGENEL